MLGKTSPGGSARGRHIYQPAGHAVARIAVAPLSVRSAESSEVKQVIFDNRATRRYRLVPAFERPPCVLRKKCFGLLGRRG